MLTIEFSNLTFRDGDVVVDIGCGEGRHIIHACIDHNIAGIGLDISLHDLITANERFKPFSMHNPCSYFYLQQADAARLPFADKSVDKIICSEVLEHIDNYRAVLHEIKRVLKPDGLLAISVPRSWPEKICWRLSAAYHQVEGGHIRIFDGRQLRDEITAIGFVCIKQHWAHALHTPFWWLKCLWWETQEQSRLIKLYHRVLVWDLMQKPWLTQTLEKLLNPVLGKSVVFYFKNNELLEREQLP